MFVFFGENGFSGNLIISSLVKFLKLSGLDPFLLTSTYHELERKLMLNASKRFILSTRTTVFNVLLHVLKVSTETKPASCPITKQNSIGWVVLETLTVGHWCFLHSACFIQVITSGSGSCDSSCPFQCVWCLSILRIKIHCFLCCSYGSFKPWYKSAISKQQAD